MKMDSRMKSRMDEKWMKKANCEQPYCKNDATVCHGVRSGNCKLLITGQHSILVSFTHSNPKRSLRLSTVLVHCRTAVSGDGKIEEHDEQVALEDVIVENWL